MLFWPVVLSLATTALYVASGGTVPDFARPPFADHYPLPPEMQEIGPWPLLPFVFLQQMLLGSAMGEEIGWRGFALPHLQARWSALGASLILGGLWGLWHLPLYLTPGHPMAEMFFGWTLLSIVDDAILFTWVFNNTHGSLLLALLFHASIAVTGLFLASAAAPPLLGLTLKWAAVLAIIHRAGAARLVLRPAH